MGNKKITLKEAIRFHGHLGPYLVLGLLAGELVLKKTGYKKFFGLKVNVYGANKKPKSCLVDGLQLSTGATYGKGNIQKFNGKKIKMEFCSRDTKKRVILTIKNPFVHRLSGAKTHKDSESLARELYNTDPLEMFFLTTTY